MVFIFILDVTQRESMLLLNYIVPMALEFKKDACSQGPRKLGMENFGFTRTEAI